MIWLNFLHFYQPAGQQKDILKAIVEQCYRPIFQKLGERSKGSEGSLTLNIGGSLLDLFDKYGYQDLIDCLRQAQKNGTIELTGSCKYHAFLPLIPEDEAHRQIKQNEETLKYYFGDLYEPRGFFPPEMGYHPGLPSILKEFGFKWVIADEIAASGTDADVFSTASRKIYKIKDSDLKIVFRNRRVSNMVMSAVISSKARLLDALSEELESDGYITTGMDGETFGHHRVGFDNFLFEMLSMPELHIKSITQGLVELEKEYEICEIDPVSSTWASSPEDIKKGSQFMSWYDKENPIHQLQWEFMRLALKIVNECGSSDSDQSSAQSSKEYVTIRHKMDEAMSSDHYWWASGKPWWSLEMIEVGAFRLLDVVQESAKYFPQKVTKDDMSQASELYGKIVSTAFSWQRTGKIREEAGEQEKNIRIPFKDRTVGQGGAEEGVYWAFVDMMKDQEKKAHEAGNYEEAILWRDSLYKLEKKLDIYEAMNAVNLLRSKLPNEQVEKFIAEYKEKYQKMRGGQPEQRG